VTLSVTSPAQQVRLVLSHNALAYLDALAVRSGLRRHQALDRLLREAQALEGRVQGLGFEHVGELVGAYRAMLRQAGEAPNVDQE